MSDTKPITDELREYAEDWDWLDTWHFKFCPNCGAKVVDE